MSSDLQIVIQAEIAITRGDLQNVASRHTKSGLVGEFHSRWGCVKSLRDNERTSPTPDVNLGHRFKWPRKKDDCILSVPCSTLLPWQLFFMFAFSSEIKNEFSCKFNNNVSFISFQFLNLKRWKNKKKVLHNQTILFER